MGDYNVSSMFELHIVTTRYNLSNLLYSNYMTLNFDTFSTKLKATFDTMERYGEGRFKRYKVSAFL